MAFCDMISMLAMKHHMSMAAYYYTDLMGMGHILSSLLKTAVYKITLASKIDY